jgi:predicted ArsR family transcriptional regulator
MTAKKENPLHQRDRIKRQPCRRLEVLALLAMPMTRHALGSALGVSYDAAAVHVATLQAQGLVTPCGYESTPGKRTYRMLFKAAASK